ncbi:MAG TPA: hypothetical protein VLD58_16585, partial [Gemmatimonadales bacterium]|nr:hypothetical protein [Gemmatimonadales bacterium]
RGDLRVRHRGNHASIEVDRAMRPLLEQAWSRVEARLLALGFERVALDPRGYRRGGLLAELPVLGT